MSITNSDAEIARVRFSPMDFTEKQLRDLLRTHKGPNRAACLEVTFQRPAATASESVTTPLLPAHKQSAAAMYEARWSGLPRKGRVLVTSIDLVVLNTISESANDTGNPGAA